MEKVAAFGAHAGAKAMVSKGLQYASGGTIQIPGALGSGIDAGQAYGDAWDAARAAD
jgi:hypothetical protein